MGCNKCHGWMEFRYHPQVYGKPKKNYIKKDEVLEKKLNHREPSRKSREGNIQSIANK